MEFSHTKNPVVCLQTMTACPQQCSKAAPLLHTSLSPAIYFFLPKFGRSPWFMAQIRLKTLSRDPSHPTSWWQLDLPIILQPHWWWPSPPLHAYPTFTKKYKGKGTNFETMGGQNGTQCSLRTNWEQNDLLKGWLGVLEEIRGTIWMNLQPLFIWFGWQWPGSSSLGRVHKRAEL